MAYPFIHVIMLGCACKQAWASSTQAGTPTVEQWGQWEQSWPGPTDHATHGNHGNHSNPFVDVELTVELTMARPIMPLDPDPASASSKSHASRSNYTHPTSAHVRGFYDGGGTYTARFMPPARGTWSFRTHSNVATLDGQHGTFAVVAPRKGNHGPVVAKPNSTTFSYADGNAHHSVGTTVYGMFGQTDNVTARTLESLRTAPFNKVRVFAFAVGDTTAPSQFLPYQRAKEDTGVDLTRFNPVYWRNMEAVVQGLLDRHIQADVILFNLYMQSYPMGLACMGGVNASTYNLAMDTLFLKYIVARLASYRNVWWSMSNEWNQCVCKWAGAAVNPCPNRTDYSDYSDPGCGVDGSNSPAVDTPIWDQLFKTVQAEDPSGHLMSIHNNGYLYNYSRPWITHFSIQHTHNKPKTMWLLHGRKPFVWDEIKYEGSNTQNWGSLSGPQVWQTLLTCSPLSFK